MIYNCFTNELRLLRRLHRSGGGGVETRDTKSKGGGGGGGMSHQPYSTANHVLHLRHVS